MMKKVEPVILPRTKPLDEVANHTPLEIVSSEALNEEFFDIKKLDEGKQSARLCPKTSITG